MRILAKQKSKKKPKKAKKAKKPKRKKTPKLGPGYKYIKDRDTYDLLVELI
jgi:hypothetical protein